MTARLKWYLDTLSLHQVNKKEGKKKRKKKKKTLSKLDLGFFGICQYIIAADCFTNYTNSTISYTF